MRNTTRRAKDTRKKSVACAYLCRTALMVAIGICLPVHAASAQAGNAEATVRFDIPAGGLAGALERFSTQSGIQLLYRNDLVAGKRARAVAGSLTPHAALWRLLEGSGVEIERLDETTFVLKPAAAPAAQRTPAAPAATVRGTPESEGVQELERLAVTGTRIRGGSTPSPVITIGSEQIEEEGFADLGEVIRRVPQNFSGGQNPGVMDAVGVANFNDTGSSGLNLRGLGPDTSLTLLNGRRMSYDGISQAIDISAIPVEAVDRMEIVADGASAVYGSDAVGGVGNVILKRDFDRVAIGARYGDATDGGLSAREYTVTTGGSWSGGGLIATYKDSSADPIYSNQREYTEHFDYPRTIYPGMGMGSGLLSAYQGFGNAIELRLDAFRTKRDQESCSWFSTYYSCTSRGTANSLMSPGVEFSLPGDWTISLWATRGKNETLASSAQTALATGVLTPVSSWRYRNASRTYEVGAEGPLLALRGGDARLAAGAGYRMNDFLYHSYTGMTRIEGDEGSRFAYIELNLPLIGSESNVAGVRRLELTAAVRGEDYDSFGGVATPKVGLIYGLGADFTVKSSWGRSFKAPTLYQQYWGQVAYLYPGWLLGGNGYPADATVLAVGGGGTNLEPERARTWTASLAFHPAALPGLEAQLTWFDIDYTDRVVQPVTDLLQALVNPIYAEFIVHSPTAGQQAEVISASTFTNVAGADYDPGKVMAIILNQYVNAARQRLSGFDLSGSYQFDLEGGRLAIRGSASWLDSSQQTSAGQNTYDLAGTLFNPARVSSRLGTVWSRGGFVGSAFINYAGGVTDTVTQKKTAPFTTFDATLRYDTGGRGNAWSELEFSLSVQNLFDRAPPLLVTESPNALPYDSTNYSAFGRHLSLSVSKHW